MFFITIYVNIKSVLDIDNNIFTWVAGGRALTQSETQRKVVGIMTTYEEFMVLLTMGLLIVAILNLKNKK